MANLVSFLGLTRTEHSQAAQLSLMTPREAGVPPGQSMEKFSRRMGICWEQKFKKKSKNFYFGATYLAEIV